MSHIKEIIYRRCVVCDEIYVVRTNRQVCCSYECLRIRYNQKMNTMPVDSLQYLMSNLSRIRHKGEKINVQKEKQLVYDIDRLKKVKKRYAQKLKTMDATELLKKVGYYSDEK